MNQSAKLSKVTKVDLHLLQRLVPLHILSEKRIRMLAKALMVREIERGDLLFYQGDTDASNYYLLVGQVALISGGKVVEKISAEDDVARYPLAHKVPREYTIRATRHSRYVKIDSQLLSKVLGESHSTYEVDDFNTAAANEDWMTQLLHSRVMQQIPASNIQRVMMSIEQYHADKGEKIITQGDQGDYYFIINQGQAAVLHQRDKDTEPTEVAKLGPGSAFGEEALLSHSPRNSTVVMLTDGELMRLQKNDFMELIGQPLSRSISFDEAQKRIESHESIWLDIRDSDEYEQSHMQDAVNLPYPVLRFQASALAANRHYIIYCDNVGQAVAAAYLLTERGLDVSVLSDGLASLPLDSQEQQEAFALREKLEQTERQLINANERVETNADLIQSLNQKIDDLKEQYIQSKTEATETISSLQDEITVMKLELDEANREDTRSTIPDNWQQIVEEHRALKDWKERTQGMLHELLNSDESHNDQNIVTNIRFGRHDDS